MIDYKELAKEDCIFVNHLAKIPQNIRKEDRQKWVDKTTGKINTVKIKRKDFVMSDNFREFLSELFKLEVVATTKEIKYTVFRLKKKSGGYREIEAPNEEIKEIGRVFLKIMKKYKMLCHNSVHGFVPHRNTKTALKVHQDNRSKWFLKLDIEKFFDSFSEPFLDNQLRKYLYTGTTIQESACYKGRLTQGNPMSPMLANLAFVEYDYYIDKFCKENGLVYTRYADDMLISSRVGFDFKAVEKEIEQILCMHKENPFKLKKRKTRYGSIAGKNWNLGLMLNKDNEITVGSKNKKVLKAMMHNANTKGCTDEEKYKINGLLGYYKYIEPEYFKDKDFL